jgi:hypothetical protein
MKNTQKFESLIEKVIGHSPNPVDPNMIGTRIEAYSLAYNITIIGSLSKFIIVVNLDLYIF